MFADKNFLLNYNSIHFRIFILTEFAKKASTIAEVFCFWIRIPSLPVSAQYSLLVFTSYNSINLISNNCSLILAILTISQCIFKFTNLAKVLFMYWWQCFLFDSPRNEVYNVLFLFLDHPEIKRRFSTYNWKIKGNLQ